MLVKNSSKMEDLDKQYIFMQIWSNSQKAKKTKDIWSFQIIVKGIPFWIYNENLNLSKTSGWEANNVNDDQRPLSEASGPEVIKLFFLLTLANSFLLNIAKHEIFSANKYENANFCWHFHIY